MNFNNPLIFTNEIGTYLKGIIGIAVEVQVFVLQNIAKVLVVKIVQT